MIETKKYSEHAGVIDMRLANLAGAAATEALTAAAQTMFPSASVVHTKRTNANRNVFIVSVRKLDASERGELETSYFMQRATK